MDIFWLGVVVGVTAILLPSACLLVLMLKTAKKGTWYDY